MRMSRERNMVCMADMRISRERSMVSKADMVRANAGDPQEIRSDPLEIRWQRWRSAPKHGTET